MNQTYKTISKYWFPALCIIVSVFLYIDGFTSGDIRTTQTDLALYGVIAIFVIGVVSLLFLLDIIPSIVTWILMAVFAGGAIFFGIKNVDTIKEELRMAEERQLNNMLTIQKLKDVRTAQIAFLDANGHFTKDWGELKNFIKNGKVQTVKNIGLLPDSIPTSRAFEKGMYLSRPAGMTDRQILDSGLFVSDTLYESAITVLFKTEKAMQKRKAPLDIDKLDEAPGTKGKKFIMNAGMINISGVNSPVFECVHPVHPKNKDKDPMSVGSMTKVTTNGNWKE